MNREQRRLNARLGRQRSAKRSARPKLGGLAAIGNSLPFPQEEAARISNEARLAWYRMSSGEGSPSAFDELVYAFNTLRVLADGLGPEPVEVVHNAQMALLRIRERHAQDGTFTTDDEALHAIPAALDLHDEFLNHCTPRQMFGALTEAIKRMEGARNELRNGL
jgi:hypothetical protein